MAAEIRIPKLGLSATEMTLTEWLFGDGEEVEKGDSVYPVATDTRTPAIAAEASGSIRPTGVAGAVYEVGALIGTIE